MDTLEKTNETVQCHGCGVHRNPSVDEVYPYPEDGLITDEPISPLFDLDVEPERAAWLIGSEPGPTSPHGNPAPRWKSATVCHHCFHKLEPDMWIHERCWRSINPVVEFKDLPDLP